MFKREGGVNHGRVAHSCERRGRVDSRSVALYTYVKGGYILEGRGRFWEGRICPTFFLNPGSPPGFFYM